MADEGALVTNGGFRALAGHFNAADKATADPSRTAPVGPGVFLQWMIDEVLGARHHRMLFIEYQPGAAIALHDHTFEETYFVLDGEIEAVLDGETYLVKPGDVVFVGPAGVTRWNRLLSQLLPLSGLISNAASANSNFAK